MKGNVQDWDGIRLTTQIGNDLFLTENRPEWSEIIGSDVVDLERFVPRTMLFKKDGDVALLCDDNDDSDGGIAVCVKPSLEIKLQDDYL